MQTQASDACVSNYLIVETDCRVCGNLRMKVAADGSDRPRTCPRCHRHCECVYAGHGFSSEGVRATVAVQ